MMRAAETENANLAMRDEVKIATTKKKSADKFDEPGIAGLTHSRLA